jgi:branched-chain amino acid transport system permease protein
MTFDLAQFVGQFLNGLSTASTLFLVSVGLSLIFGVTRIVNFAHGSFYMLGAYIAYTLTAFLPATPLGFWGGLALAAVAAGLLGVVMEVVILRRIYHAPALFQILATFGVILVVSNLTQTIWGAEDEFTPLAPGLKGAVRILGLPYPQYDLAMIGLGPLVLIVLWVVFSRTRWGILIRAATQDREMAGALGVNQKLLFTSVLFLGCLLGGLGGAVQLPKGTINLQMDLSIIVEAFVVVVVGGMGNVLGAFLAALVIGEVQAFSAALVPEATQVVTFLAMAVVLVFRPHGLLGKAEGEQRVGTGAADLPHRHASPRLALFGWIVLVLLLVAPVVLGGYGRVVLNDMLIWALFASSLAFIMGIGGMVSFGHAAYFGLGAYAVAMLSRYLGAPMIPSLIAAPVAGALGALVFGALLVRLSGVYFAMLTLAFAQILWSIAEQYTGITGGDNGILGIAPASWLGNRVAFGYFVLALAVAGMLLLRRAVFAPFGYALRAGRDSPLRADAIGIDVRRVQWLGFILGGAFAGLAGGLAAYKGGNVFPTVTSINTSIDALVMVLLGGVQTLAGAAVGAFAYLGLETEMIQHLHDYWRLTLGIVIIALAILFPQGIVGFLRHRLGAAFGMASEG